MCGGVLSEAPPCDGDEKQEQLHDGDRNSGAETPLLVFIASDLG